MAFYKKNYHDILLNHIQKISELTSQPPIALTDQGKIIQMDKKRSREQAKDAIAALYYMYKHELKNEGRKDIIQQAQKLPKNAGFREHMELLHQILIVMNKQSMLLYHKKTTTAAPKNKGS